MPTISVIIPTHSRAPELRQCLKALERQTIVDELEVIVVNDVADDKRFQQVADAQWKLRMRFMTVPPCHQATARNRGMEKATGQYIMFIGDDILLDKRACELHAAAHEKTKAAVLGFTTWDPAVGITSVMKWLERSGWQFGYPHIDRYAHGLIPQKMQHLFSYTSHISLKKEDALAHPFREDVTLYGWEDVEWGTRLRDDNVHLYYEPDAAALHHHKMTIDQSLARMETLGESVVHLSHIAPELDRRPTGMMYWAYVLAAMLPTMAGRHRKAFLYGIRKASKTRDVRR